MSIPLCPSPQPSPRQLQPHNQTRAPKSRGQVLVIFAVSLVTLLLFAGLAVDAGIIYVSYAQLKRGLDAGSVAAANAFKRGQDMVGMEASAREVLTMHNIDSSNVNLTIKICDVDGDGLRDAALLTDAPQFHARCPNTPAEAPRKLVWLQARMQTSFYFMSLIGITGMQLTTDSTSEAAAVDLVIVIDTSESMGNGPGTNPNCEVGRCEPNHPSTGCNLNNSCAPLNDAKDAATALVTDFLYQGYDQVSVVTFNTKATTQLGLSGDLASAQAAIQSIQLHDDPPVNRLRRSWLMANQPDSWYGAFNPVNPEDRDGDGRDADPGAPCNDPDGDGWDPDTPGPAWASGVVGVPCDDDNRLDAYDWDSDGFVSDEEAERTRTMVQLNQSLSPLSTCTGCGLRIGANILKEHGRQGSVWVIILLSDGQVNMTDMGVDGHNVITSGDTPDGSSNVRAGLPNGYCTGGYNTEFWTTMCRDPSTTTRYCIDTDSGECPQPYTGVNVVHTNQVSVNYHYYSVDDYTRDIADETALTFSANQNEPLGNDIAIYTIGLAVNSAGENLLRYIANVGDDGNRENPPTCAANTSCGNYFYATGGDDLRPIFENIASRIYTRIND